ncbi:kelch repeat protein [Dictyocaulus viviparus]|uniref:Kelch repeat protein n=1 Tax=Dictyocaulus viviparus TaxID=29172 RepID=A0A0D8XHJ6_DICVI|nr:kelch repeat protein [Dictyocaulus viviparus]
MLDDQYFDLILESKDGIVTQWRYSHLQRQCPYLESKATSKNYKDLKMILTLPYSQHLINLLINSNEPLNRKNNWLSLEFALEDMGNDKDFQILKDKIFQYAIRHINISNCLSIWRKLFLLASPFADEALRFVLYNLIRGVFERTICYQFYRLPLEHLKAILDHDKLNVYKEDDVLTVIDAWIEACVGRNDFRNELLGTVRVAGLSAEKRKSLEDRKLVDLLSEKPKREPRDQILMFGGWYNGRTHSRIDLFDEVTYEWRPLCGLSLIHPIAYHGAVVLNNELYLIGGTDGENHFSTVMKLNMKGEWIEVAPMFETRTYISNSCCVLDGMIYVCGGFDVRGVHQRRRNDRLRCVERYDPKLNKWEIITNMNHMRSDCAAVSAGGRLYVSGGFSGLEVQNSVEVYTPLTNTWIEVASMPGPRSGHCMVLYDPHTLFVIGGFDGQERMNTVLSWKIGHLTWGNGPSMKTSRSNFAACMHNGELIVAGGYSSQKTIAGAEKYDGKQWSSLPDLPTNRSAMKIMKLSDFRDFALTKIGTKEEQKKWKEEERKTNVENTRGAIRSRSEGEALNRI